MVEWPGDLHPIALDGVTNDTFLSDFMTFLTGFYPVGTTYASQYYNEFGVTPNCTVVPNVTPLRVTCPKNDLLVEFP